LSPRDKMAVDRLNVRASHGDGRDLRREKGTLRLWMCDSGRYEVSWARS